MKHLTFSIWLEDDILRKSQKLIQVFLNHSFGHLDFYRICSISPAILGMQGAVFTTLYWFIDQHRCFLLADAQ